MHAFLRENAEGSLDVSVFDFTTPKDKSITTSTIVPSQAKHRRTKKKHADGLKETARDATKNLDSSPIKCRRAPSSCRRTKRDKVKCVKKVKNINTDIVFDEVTHGEKTEDTDKCCTQATVDDAEPQNSRVGLLREKLFRLGPSSNQNTSIKNNEHAVLQPSLPALNVEPATECDSEGEDEQGRDKIQIHSKGDKKPVSELEADADSCRDVEEEVLPDNTDGSCTPVRDSQNSKYEPH